MFMFILRTSPVHHHAGPCVVFASPVASNINAGCALVIAQFERLHADTWNASFIWQLCSKHHNAEVTRLLGLENTFVQMFSNQKRVSEYFYFIELGPEHWRRPQHRWMQMFLLTWNFCRVQGLCPTQHYISRPMALFRGMSPNQWKKLYLEPTNNKK